MKKIKLLAVIPFLPMMGCSVTTLQCGTDGDSSFISLKMNSDILPNQTQQLTKLCNFSQEQT